MSFERLMGTAQRLSASMEALAALGAELRLRRDGAAAHAQTRQILQQVIGGIDPSLFDGVTPEQEALVLASIKVGFHQACDLLDDPAREPGWLHEEPEVLQTIGQLSRRIVHQIDALAAQRPALKDTVSGTGAFLDIGTGVGWLGIEAARLWPSMRVTGIDVWEPSLDLARANIVASGVHERMDLRNQSVVHLDDEAAFSVVWYPAPFLPIEITDAALTNSYRALAPGGWLVFGVFAPPPDPLGEALTALKIVRCGGHPWRTGEVEERLRALGLEEIETYAPGSVSVLVVGRKPQQF